MNNEETIGEQPMKYVLSFVLGTVFGALAGGLVALLFAPSSGEELRTNIKSKADTEYAKLQDELQKGVQGVQTRMGKMSSEMSSEGTSTPA
jgi:gas vesicle protein